MKVASFDEHPEEVGHHKVVVYGRDQSTPRLKTEETPSQPEEPKQSCSVIGSCDQWDLVALVDVVVNQLKQKPHDVPQDEGGDQVPVDDVPQTPDAPEAQKKDYFH